MYYYQKQVWTINIFQSETVKYIILAEASHLELGDNLGILLIECNNLGPLELYRRSMYIPLTWRSREARTAIWLKLANEFSLGKIVARLHGAICRINTFKPITISENEIVSISDRCNGKQIFCVHYVNILMWRYKVKDVPIWSIKHNICRRILPTC